MFNYRFFLTTFLVISIVSAFILSACSVNSRQDVPAHNWKMSIVTSEDSSWYRGARLFADLVKKRSGGRMQITVYPDSKLAGGDQLKELKMLQDGSVNFTYHSNLLYSNLDQSFAAFSMPWLFTRYDQVDMALSGTARTQLLERTEALGIVGLAYGENGFRQLTNSKLEVHTREDMQGLRIRIPGVDLYDSVFKALGAVPVKMNFGEVVEALKQGEIDGQENPIDVIASSRLYEVQKHITIWNYSYYALILGMNRKDWDSLPVNAQNIIRAAVVEASKEKVRLSRETALNQLNLLSEKGMTITEPVPQHIRAFREITDKVHVEWSDRIVTAFSDLQGR